MMINLKQKLQVLPLRLFMLMKYASAYGKIEPRLGPGPRTQ
jgi:hypothetical protein